MTFSPRLPFPVTIFRDVPLIGTASQFGALTAYLFSDGSVEFLATSDAIPVGAIAASVADSGDGSDEIVTPAVPTGRRVVLSSLGDVLLA